MKFHKTTFIEDTFSITYERYYKGEIIYSTEENRFKPKNKTTKILRFIYDHLEKNDYLPISDLTDEIHNMFDKKHKETDVDSFIATINAKFRHRLLEYTRVHPNIICLKYNLKSIREEEEEHTKEYNRSRKKDKISRFNRSRK